MKPKTIKLEYGDRIIAVVPERCAGPGWVNCPVWVYILANDGRLKQECIQPEERSSEMHTLFDVGASVNLALIAAEPVRKTKRPKGE